MKKLVDEVKEFVDGYYDFQEDQKMQGVWQDEMLESYADDAMHYLQTIVEMIEKIQREGELNGKDKDRREVSSIP